MAWYLLVMWESYFTVLKQWVQWWILFYHHTSCFTMVKQEDSENLHSQVKMGFSAKMCFFCGKSCFRLETCLIYIGYFLETGCIVVKQDSQTTEYLVTIIISCNWLSIWPIKSSSSKDSTMPADVTWLECYRWLGGVEYCLYTSQADLKNHRPCDCLAVSCSFHTNV